VQLLDWYGEERGRKMEAQSEIRKRRALEGIEKNTHDMANSLKGIYRLLMTLAPREEVKGDAGEESEEVEKKVEQKINSWTDVIMGLASNGKPDEEGE
jgi:hypothetical protein